MHDVVILGLGHVGLPLAAVISSTHRVWGVDPRGEAVFDAVDLEPGLAEAVAGIQLGEPAAAVDVGIIAVPTPLGPAGADLSAVQAATARLIPWMRPDGLVLLASTCPVGTLASLSVPSTMALATLPERGMPGRMLAEMTGAPRLVGGRDAASSDRAVAFVQTWCDGPVHAVAAEEAELAKLVENSWRDLSIAFANQVATAAEALGLHGARVLQLASTHPRVQLAQAGIGVGGHCLPVDPHFLPASVTLARAARAANEARTAWMVARIREAAKGRSVGCLGLAYKPDTADARNAPAVAIVKALGALAYDPHVQVPGVRQGRLADVLACGLVVKLVAHTAFAGIDVALDLTGAPTS